MKGTKKAYGQGHLYVKSGINVLHLRGTHTEMAAQHGVLLREQIQTGALPFLGARNAEVIGHAPIFRNRPGLKKAVMSLIKLLVQKPMLAHVPRQYMAEVRALAQAAELPYDLCEQGLLQADTLVLLIRLFMGKYLMRNVGKNLVAGGLPGCTSVVATGLASGTGKVIHARNMDYPVVGRWDVHPTVMYFDPQGLDKGQRYIGIASAGIHTAGVTGINENGITLSAHFHCSKSVSPFGTPIQVIGAEVLRKAKTLGQAIDIATDFDRAGSWAIVLSSAKENDASVVEMVHGKANVLPPEDGRLAHSNHYHTRSFQDDEVLLSAGITNDCIQRYSRAMQLLEKKHGQLDRTALAQILGDSFDGETKRVRGHGNTISVVTTVTSMISEAADGRFWVANSGKSPTCLGTYAGFKLDETFENFDDAEPEILDWPATETTIRDTPKMKAFNHFRDGYIAFHTEYNEERAVVELGRAAAADPDEGHYHLAYGHFLMRTRQCQAALEAFKKAEACVLSPHMSQVTKLFLGHALDCLDRRAEAVAQYEQVVQLAVDDPHLKGEAKRCLKKPYSPDRVANLTFDLQFCDSVEYA